MTNGSLGEALPKELARVREVLGIYKAIGPAGTIGAMLIEQSLHSADLAIMGGDIAAMTQAYKDLRRIE